MNLGAAPQNALVPEYLELAIQVSAKQKKTCDIVGLIDARRVCPVHFLFVLRQFGFMAMFIPACPLLPAFLLLNNAWELRLDARKFVFKYR